MLRVLRSFWRNERGSIPLEGIYGSLLLLGWLMVAFQFYDAFRTRSVALRASYTVGDLISRERNAIGPTYVNGVKKVFDFLTRAPNSNYTWLRVSLVSCKATATDTNACDGTSKQFTLDSSYTTNTAVSKHTTATINAENGRIPIMAAGDMAVIVESSLRYYPLFAIGDMSFRTGGDSPFIAIGLSEKLRFSNFVVTRPRGPRTVWDATR